MDNYNRDIKINKEAFTHENAAVCNNFVDSLKKGIQTSTRDGHALETAKLKKTMGDMYGVQITGIKTKHSNIKKQLEDTTQEDEQSRKIITDLQS